MVTTHQAMKTFYFRTRTGEFRGITTKTFITPGLRHDLLSVKSLNRQGYCVIQHPDPDESGIYPVINGQIDKLKSFTFMNEHSNLFCLKPKNAYAATIRQNVGIREVAPKIGTCIQS